MTMRELAKIANVSISTVSKAFRDAEDVSEDTKRHIFSVAKENGCYGKFYKEKFSKKVIAVICAELISGHYSDFAERLQKIIEENNGIALHSADHFDAARQAELIEYYASYLHVDGILVIGLRAPLKKGYDVPIVSIFPSKGCITDSVSSDLEHPIAEAMELLCSLGHKNIAFISEPLTVGKAKCFETVAERFPVSYRTIRTNDRFEMAGQNGVEKLLREFPEATAIFCAYDEVAFGAIKKLKECGFSVPKDFSVIGMDNIHTAAFSETALTSIGVNPDEICMIAWDLLEKKQKNKFYRSGQKITVLGELVVRESLGKARES